MRTHALGQPERQASALMHEREHASPQIVNRELPFPAISHYQYADANQY